jgi:glycosyltransferase involved in cell wall biosynthesis
MNTAARRVLIVVYHYPPVAGSSGVQRTLKFTRYLRDHGWEPTVLTVAPWAFERVTDGQMAEIPPGLRVERAFALDSARHLSIKGRFPTRLAMPDRWCSWWLDGVRRGMQIIREEQPAMLMSTFPIATAHQIARTLQQRSGLPWVADFRDNMTDPEYPPDPKIWRFNRQLEEQAVAQCARAVFTTRGALQMYAERYPDLPADRWAIVENGYDEENFRDAERDRMPAARLPGAPLRLVHSGILYPAERDPRAFFAAIARLKASGVLLADRVRIVLRATASDDVYSPQLAQAGIDDIVELAPPVGYRQALQEMLDADGLLLFQASMANHQIPAKLYEYMRAGRPILALTDPDGDTAAAMRAAGTGVICRLADADDITMQLQAYVDGLRNGSVQGTQRAQAERHSRRARTAELAALFDGVARRN